MAAAAAVLLLLLVAVALRVAVGAPVMVYVSIEQIPDVLLVVADAAASTAVLFAGFVIQQTVAVLAERGDRLRVRRDGEAPAPRRAALPPLVGRLVVFAAVYRQLHPVEVPHAVRV